MLKDILHWQKGNSSPMGLLGISIQEQLRLRKACMTTLADDLAKNAMKIVGMLGKGIDGIPNIDEDMFSKIIDAVEEHSSHLTEQQQAALFFDVLIIASVKTNDVIKPIQAVLSHIHNRNAETKFSDN